MLIGLGSPCIILIRMSIVLTGQTAQPELLTCFSIFATDLYKGIYMSI